MENKLRIADDVIAIIVELALADVPGIYASDKRKNKKNLGKGIQVKVEDDAVICDLELSIGEDVKVPQMAADVQTRVKNAIENMTGLEVKEVNIKVFGITKEEASEE